VRREWRTIVQALVGTTIFVSFWPILAWLSGNILAELAAGNVLDFTLVLYNVALGYGVPIGGTGPTIAAPVGSRPTVGLQNPVIIHAGESLAIWVSSFAGANITGQFNICYTRLDA